MKIALLVTGPPGVRGGAEEYYDGLDVGIREAGHDVERVHIPCDESTFEGILEGYVRAREMDLSGFDAVVSTKAPTFAVRHPRHVAYLVHTIRVFYDMFESWTDGHLDRCFERDRIRELDYEAFAAIPEKRRFAIGEEVASRLWRAIGIKATVIHPAVLDSDRFHEGPFEHFLHVGRLHEWKRADLVVRAFRRARTDAPLLIAGTGSQQARLHELAGADPRIRFLGHVSRDELIELYSRALAVPFVPLREDFGYVTIEAMLSGKPVITAADSGEVVRLVEGSACGLVVRPDPAELALAMERLAGSPEEARRIGEKGVERARKCRWPGIVRTLLDSLGPQPHAPKSHRTRLLVLDSQPIEPPVGGGRLRLWGLYSHLPDDFETRYVGTYDWPGPAYRTVTHNDRLLEITVPQSREHFRAHDALKAQDPALTVDVTFPRLATLSTAFSRRVRDEVAWADIVIVSHPWVYPLLWNLSDIQGKPLLYDAHNVEGLLRRSLLGNSGLAGEIASEIERLEARLCRDAAIVFVCSQEEVDQKQYFYDVPPARIRVIPNGTDTSQIRPPDPAVREAARLRFGLRDDEPVAIFIGSEYFPNFEAVLFIAGRLALELPLVRFLLVGGSCAAFDGGRLPSNVISAGTIDDDSRNASFAAADIALNPIVTGSGTNIKMLDYLSAGLPVISTPLGARGLNPADNPAIIVVPLEGFPEAVRQLFAEPERRRALSQTARDIAEEKYDWRRISRGIAEAARELASGTQPLSAPVPVAPRRPRKPFRLGVMSTWDTRCGIADYTGFLARALPPSVDWMIYAEAKSCGTADSSRVTKNWHQQLEDPTALEESLRRDRPDVLLVQHHPAFYREDGFARLAHFREDPGVRLAVTLHAVQALRITQEFNRALAGFDRIYVHRPSDAAWLRERGCLSDVRVIRHGIVESPDRTIEEARATAGFSEDVFVVAHFGYIRPNKGTLELIEAFEILAPYFPELRLLLLCAEYPSPDSRAIRSICERRIAVSGFRERIHATFEHLALDHVELLLHASNLIVLPYGMSRESSSAAVRVAVSARRPILVSASPIFEDLQNCAEIAPSSEPHILADAVKRLLLDRELRNSAENRVRAFARAGTWPRVAARLASDLMTLAPQRASSGPPRLAAESLA